MSIGLGLLVEGGHLEPQPAPDITEKLLLTEVDGKGHTSSELGILVAL
jgi:hypothetical protein